VPGPAPSWLANANDISQPALVVSYAPMSTSDPMGVLKDPVSSFSKPLTMLETLSSSSMAMIGRVASSRFARIALPTRAWVLVAEEVSVAAAALAVATVAAASVEAVVASAEATLGVEVALLQEGASTATPQLLSRPTLSPISLQRALKGARSSTCGT
jgi:hypothetical protein